MMNYHIIEKPKKKSLFLMKKSSVYTRTGDEGFSCLYTGERRRKDDTYFRVLGLIDKVNTTIGLARQYCLQDNNQLESQLKDIQIRLFEIGSAIATPRNSIQQGKVKRTEFSLCHVEEMEEWIDTLDESLPPLTNFILPGGGLASSYLHAARADCRLAESMLVHLFFEYGSLDDSVPRYINRLSDYLFVAARYAAYHIKAEETIYKATNSM